MRKGMILDPGSMEWGGFSLRFFFNVPAAERLRRQSGTDAEESATPQGGAATVSLSAAAEQAGSE
jgi:hypothetical protein